jgi:hypothetical protein
METTERLDSWKDIAKYIRRDVGTCIKWAKLYHLPVYHIDKGSPRSRVFTFKSDIDQWFKDKTK